jgi:hypothetical protein
MTLEPDFSLARFVADVLVSIVGTLGSLIVAWVIYRATREDQRRQFEAELDDRERARQREAQERQLQEQRQQQVLNNQLAAGAMTECGHNRMAINQMRQGNIFPVNLRHDALERFTPLLATQVRPELWDPILDALISLQDFNASGPQRKQAMLDALDTQIAEAHDGLLAIVDIPGFLPRNIAEDIADEPS